ncbi:Cache sensor-containing signal transduction histidine kinase [Malaciobacter marinus]|uniref:histidine kinase n=1 Tax=Malaciobacter marinus TaxID=505249 RepID=A0A347TMG0_9BACT|nr:cache domain-containing protein [Malaciobacter marinus]AXX87788.1 Cache sensor-containing signal transduction histidine kinase [Malaciobacter marinus]PHO16522.1 histidine kinase [Malaciobacter marinus]
MIRKENKILKIIKYAPSIFILILCIIINFYLLYEKKQNLNLEKKEIKQKYITTNKELVKNEVLETIHYIKMKQKNTEKNLEQMLKKVVLNAHQISLNVYNMNKDEKKEKILEQIKKVLNNINYAKDGYFFIYDFNGVNILHGGDKSIEGRNLLDYKDSKSNNISKELNEILKTKNETYYSWYWPKNDNKEYKKIGFFKKIEPLNLYIGTGRFVVDYEQNLKKEILEYLSSVKYRKYGYIFVLDNKGKYLSYYNKDFIGKSISDLAFVENINKSFEKMKKVSKKGNYLRYDHIDKPNSVIKKIEKISYIKKFDKWNWIIGTGFYLDDVYKQIEEKELVLEKKYKEEIKTLYKITVISTIILLLISIYISKLIERIFLNYKNKIEEQIQTNRQKDNLIAYQSKMATMGEMIGNIAHQWRQPLSSISTAATGVKMQKEIGVLTDDFEIKSLDSINNNVQYLSKTIDDFRNFFKNNKTRKEFNIQDSFEKTFKLVSAQYKNKDIELISNIEDVVLCSFESKLVQVLINILNNARDELIKQNFRKLIFIEAKKVENSLIILIKDNANGINDHIKHRIFEPYFTTKSKEEGTGIGLYMSNEIVNKHLDGTLEFSNEEYEFENEKYKGACFKITLPID